MANSSDLGLLILRLGAGATMLTHGLPKLLNFAEMSTQFPDPIGLGTSLSLVLTVFAEVLCSVMLMIGFKIRIFTIPLIIVMLVAVLIVHAEDPFATKEKAIMFLFIYTALLMMGGGKYSIDRYFSRQPIA